jgi:phenylacetate-CoA ligase
MPSTMPTPLDYSDRLPVEAIQEMQFERFRTHWDQVYAHSPFHSARFKALGITPSDIRSWQDLQKLPALETRTLLSENLQFPAVPAAGLRRIIVSGGTTGNPKVCFYAQNLRDITREWAAVWQASELSADDVITVLCPIPLASGMLIMELFEDIGCTSLPVGITTPPEFVARLMKQLGATAIVTQPSSLLHFAELVRGFGYQPRDFGIRKVFLGSEVLTQNTRRQAEADWQCEVFDTSGSSEVGLIGTECRAHDGHHLAVRCAYFEVRDLDTGQSVEEGVGQLYVTTLMNLGLPLIRYDMKDLVRITHQRCACGRTTPRIWFMGRADDRFVLKTGVKFYSYQVDAALEPFGAMAGSYNVIARGDQARDHLTIIIEAPDSMHGDRELMARVSTAIIKSSVDFSEIHAADLVSDPEVQFVAIGSLERTGRGKIKDKFRDQRSS